MSEQLLPEYFIRRGSTLERSLLVKFMQRSYQYLFPDQDFAHLARTVEQYFSRDTPLWWVELERAGEEDTATQGRGDAGNLFQTLSASPRLPLSASSSPVACLWVGNAIDQVQGDRHAHIFLLYVEPEHRRRGIGTALLRYLENWATQRGDRQIGLQVFQSNQAALNLYNQLGYQTQSLWMVKSLHTNKKTGA
ncbi:GNAT family N-acetyltransferase [Nostocaceae cyanobacterium CENA369]|uniref:GNAT family N-acetyltransferase n=1 Tax=Dendronalium phyllosphericum CENA369 TaxID=1725256 RepID=A0A8J7I490_9NOST|nr:GNAT family N-acetyltransferase [Dendronalium phyllosphericum]MBH8572187.1 GNAT family N-acetyltransferase [Dendronalium phyllosphericum CENA369]